MHASIPEETVARQLHHTDPVVTFTTERHASRAETQVIQATWLAIGRAMFGGFFVFNGINHFMKLSMMTGYAAVKGVPFPEAAIAGTGALLLLGGISIILGVWPRIGAALIMLFLLGVTPVMHDFWRATDMSSRMNDFGNFTKNVALFGGACLVMALPVPWPASLGGGR
jgi:uncharacterized membrane protein YphA (DoxX/SURF4 family)